MASQSERSASLDQLPEYWNDCRLLAYGPFQVWSAMAKERFVLDGMDRPKCAKASITDRDKEFSRAFIRWCLFVFRPLNGENPKSVPKVQDFVTDPSYWELFIDVFYILFLKEEKEEKALKLVDRKRSDLGYTYFLRSLGSSRPVRLNPNGVLDLPAPPQALNPDNAGRQDEIETACEVFMRTLPKSDARLTKEINLGRKSSRLESSRRRVAELAREEEEFNRKLKISNALEKRLRKQRRQNGGGVGLHGIKNIQGKRYPAPDKDQSVAQTDAQFKDASRDISSVIMEENIMQCDHGTIVVDNTLHVSDSISIDQNGDTSGLGKGTRKPEKRNPEMTSMRGVKKQKISFHKKDKQLPLVHDLFSSPKKKIGDKKEMVKGEVGLREGSGKSKRRSQKFLPRSPSNFAVYRIKALTPQKNKKGDGLFASVSKAIRTDLSSTFQGSDDSTEVFRPFSTLCIGTRVEPAARERLGHLKGTDQNHGVMCLSSVAQTKCDAIENRTRADKISKISRLHSSSRPKPSLPDGRRPAIWAASRQALCETTSWFRSYHGGVYFSDGKVHGYLLGGYSSQRDVFCHDGKLIVSHGGGKAFDDSPGQGDQDASVRSLLYNYRARHPLVLIADDKYALFPFELGHMMYVVLGLYWIVDAWAEKDIFEVDGKMTTRVKYKFAFQYCEGQGPPWWLDDSSNISSGVNSVHSDRIDNPEQPSAQLSTETTACTDSQHSFPQITTASNSGEINNSTKARLLCLKCGMPSRPIYKQGWTCFHPRCSGFFLFNHEEVLELEYEEEFLALRTDPSFGKIELKPSSICMPDDSADSFYSIKGWRCSRCGQLCPRERWECWECSRCKITFPDDIPPPIRSHNEFRHHERDLGTYTSYKIYENSGIAVSTRKWSTPGGLDSGLHHRFELPGDMGRIHLLCGNALVNNRANMLFRQYQEEARDRPFLRRYPLRYHHARGRMLTNYFSHNAGVPYEYAVTTNVTDPFDRAPASVNGAIQLIKDRVSTIIHEKADFNEILTVAYMAEQKMSYHTDDEKGLGPIVASLSLGSIASMHFRQRRTPDNPNIGKKLTVVLRHGDVLVMEGAAIQKLFEHTVVPTNFRIAATARCIDQGAEISTSQFITQHTV